MHNKTIYRLYPQRVGKYGISAIYVLMSIMLPLILWPIHHNTSLPFTCLRTPDIPLQKPPIPCELMRDSCPRNTLISKTEYSDNAAHAKQGGSVYKTVSLANHDALGPMGAKCLRTRIQAWPCQGHAFPIPCELMCESYPRNTVISKTEYSDKAAHAQQGSNVYKTVSVVNHDALVSNVSVPTYTLGHARATHPSTQSRVCCPLRTILQHWSSRLGE